MGIRTGERRHKVKERRERHTALKRWLLSTRALCLLSAHAGAVVTSAADHLGCWSWLVGRVEDVVVVVGLRDREVVYSRLVEFVL